MNPEHPPIPVQFYDGDRVVRAALGISGAGRVWTEHDALVFEGTRYTGANVERAAAYLRLAVPLVVLGGLAAGISFFDRFPFLWWAYVALVALGSPALWVYSRVLRLRATQMFEHQVVRVLWGDVIRVTAQGPAVHVDTRAGTTELMGYGPEGIAMVHHFGHAIAARANGAGRR